MWYFEIEVEYSESEVDLHQDKIFFLLNKFVFVLIDAHNFHLFLKPL